MVSNWLADALSLAISDLAVFSVASSWGAATTGFQFTFDNPNAKCRPEWLRPRLRLLAEPRNEISLPGPECFPPSLRTETLFQVYQAGESQRGQADPRNLPPAKLR